MKRINSITPFLFAICILLLRPMSAAAQNPDISIYPYVPADFGNAGTQQLAINKLIQGLTQNGLASGNPSDAFVLTVGFDELEKLVSPNPPTIIQAEYMITYVVGNQNDKSLYASFSQNVKVTGRSDKDIANKAAKMMQTSSPEFGKFISQAKEAIIKYYKNNCESMYAEFNSLAKSRQYGAAFAIANSVPAEITACFDRFNKQKQAMYLEMQKNLCKTTLAQAENAWAADQTESGAYEAANLLNTLDPAETSCFKGGQALSKKIASTLRKDNLRIENQDYQFMLKKFNSEVSLEEQRIRAIREIGVAYGKNQPSPTIHYKEFIKQ